MAANTAALRWLLPISLALNAFLVGVVIGRFDHRPFGPPPPKEMAERMADGLPAADAALLRQAFAAHSGQFDLADQAMHGFPERIRQVLDAADYDPKALQEVLMEGHAAHDARDEAMSLALLDAAAKMSAEGRRKLAIGRPPPGGPR
ncbi:MAG TPA: periplasmic heavy metal sensor [Patescibacteria group bacterium]|nr:periplasmic heavy metal sensor [Patescibacteria group bacterium]